MEQLITFLNFNYLSESLLEIINWPANASLRALYLSPVVEIGCNIGVVVLDSEKLFSFNDAPAEELLVNGEGSVFDIKGRILVKGEKIEQAWKQLTINLNGKSIIPEKNVFNFAQCLVKELEYKKEQSLCNTKKSTQEISDMCGLCLLSVSRSNCPSKDEQYTLVLDSVLDHGNRRYHSTCANFWVNRVDFVLPTLTLNPLTCQNKLNKRNILPKMNKI